MDKEIYKTTLHPDGRWRVRNDKHDRELMASFILKENADLLAGVMNHVMEHSMASKEHHRLDIVFKIFDIWRGMGKTV